MKSRATVPNPTVSADDRKSRGAALDLLRRFEEN